MKKLIYRLSYMVVGMTLVMSGYLMGGEHSIASATTLTPSAKTVTTYVTKKAVDMKAGKHRKNKTLNTIPKGKTVTHVKSYGSWTQVKYGSKTGYVPTSSLGNKKVITVKPAPKPTPALTPVEKDKVMSSVFVRTESEMYSLNHTVKKTGRKMVLGTTGHNFNSGTGAFTIDISSFDGAYERTNVLGKEVQDEYKLMYAKYTSGIKAFTSVTLGAKHASVLQSEFERFTMITGAGNKTTTVFIGGRSVVFSKSSPTYRIQVK